MKGKWPWFILLAFLPLVAAVIILPMLPDQIPAHYGFDGVVNRWGSKYELLIMPITTAAFAPFFLLLIWVEQKMESHTEQNKRVLAIAALSTLGLFNLMCAFFFYLAFTQATSINSQSFDFLRVIGIAFGGLLMVFGNVMPKCKQNAMVGIRFTWTLKNEQVWYLTHRRGGRVFILGGLLTILVNLFLLHGFASILSILVVPIGAAVYLGFYARNTYRRILGETK